jgi:hypothetical protein
MYHISSLIHTSILRRSDNNTLQLVKPVNGFQYSSIFWYSQQNVPLRKLICFCPQVLRLGVYTQAGPLKAFISTTEQVLLTFPHKDRNIQFPKCCVRFGIQNDGEGPEIQKY